MEGKPLIVLPEPGRVERRMLQSRPPGISFPTHERQRERLTPQFVFLRKVFKSLSGTPSGAPPERVLVLEIAGSVEDFAKAVKKVESGLEWLGEIELEEIEPDVDFRRKGGDETKTFGGRLFLIMANQKGVDYMLSLWRSYKRDADFKFPRGFTKFRDVFKSLRNIRLWGVEDRLIETGVLQDWGKRLELGMDLIRFEAELWFRGNKSLRVEKETAFEEVLIRNAGRIVNKVVLEQIGYHGVLVELPRSSVVEIINNPNTELTESNEVMFYKALGQTAVPIVDEETNGETFVVNERYPEGEPEIALLDGLPLGTHEALDQRLIIDDPDGWGENYPPHERFHGTAMASLIIHGDFADGSDEPLEKPLYVRPIMKAEGFGNFTQEVIPEGELPVDIVYRSIKRMYEGDGEEAPTASGVKIINFSIGDKAKPFIQFVSPWARLMDWLSYKNNVLFIVSAGNHDADLDLNIRPNSARDLPRGDLETAVIRSVYAEMRYRRLLSPAEAINVLTVGGFYNDNSTPSLAGRVFEAFETEDLPCPYNAIGLGYRRSIKPDLLAPGGRVLFMETPGSSSTVSMVKTSRPPGHSVASPGTTPGVLNSTRYCRGTSNAAALTVRAGAKTLKLIEELQNEPGGNILKDVYVPVLIKALIVHGVAWPETSNQVLRVLGYLSNWRESSECLSRFYGYGNLNVDRVLSCSDQRCSLVGCGSLSEDEAHLYSIPLPPSLSGSNMYRRLTITLAWLSPVNYANRRYRCATLWFDTTAMDKIGVKRVNPDWRAAQRGTVQHETFEGEDIAVFVADDSLEIKVNCRADAGGFDGEVNYGLAVTLEVAPDIDVSIYDEIRTLIRPPTIITPSAAS
ncbi:MAG: S8 family peptidase [Candidatus Zixiibacteriota bacterium]|jgi:hypothetical protein